MNTLLYEYMENLTVKETLNNTNYTITALTRKNIVLYLKKSPPPLFMWKSVIRLKLNFLAQMLLRTHVSRQHITIHKSLMNNWALSKNNQVCKFFTQHQNAI